MPDHHSSAAGDRTVMMCLLQQLSLSHVYMPPHIHYTDSAVWHACPSSLPDRLHTPQGSVLSPSYQSLFYCSITINYKIKSHSSKFHITRTPSSCPVSMPEHLEQKDKWKQCLNYERNKWYKKNSWAEFGQCSNDWMNRKMKSTSWHCFSIQLGVLKISRSMINPNRRGTQ